MKSILSLNSTEPGSVVDLSRNSKSKEILLWLFFSLNLDKMMKCLVYGMVYGTAGWSKPLCYITKLQIEGLFPVS